MVLVLVELLLLVLVGVALGRVARLAAGSRGDGEAAQRKELWAARRAERRDKRDIYLDSLEFVNFYQLVVIFAVASIGGLVLETLWVAVNMGIWQRRYGMVWGPFSPLYGFGAVILTLALWRIRKQPVWAIFFVSVVLGSCLEQFAGAVMEGGFHVTSWDYSALPDAITKYVSLRMSAMWGLLGCLWCKLLMPEILYAIGEPKRPVRTVVTVLLTVFLVVDGIMTLYVAVRKDARDQGIPPANAAERWIDVRYDDSFMKKRFENAEFERS